MVYIAWGQFGFGQDFKEILAGDESQPLAGIPGKVDGADIVDELHRPERARGHGLKFGVYFSGALDWHVSDLPPIQSDRDLFTFRRQDSYSAKYAAVQLQELIHKFQPEVLWNDIEWPDSGKGTEPYSLQEIFKEYLLSVPEGVVNDRWGIPVQGFKTREYRNIDTLQPQPWEATRGLSRSFGFNRNDTENDCISGPELVKFFVDTVAKNGNLLINVGPRADGTIPEVQLKPLRELGSFMQSYGEIIYGSRPYRDGIINGAWWLEKAGEIFVFTLPGQQPEIPAELAGRQLILQSGVQTLDVYRLI